MIEEACWYILTHAQGDDPDLHDLCHASSQSKAPLGNSFNSPP